LVPVSEEVLRESRDLMDSIEARKHDTRHAARWKEITGYVGQLALVSAVHRVKIIALRAGNDLGKPRKRGSRRRP
jgi:hypothetical protein